MPSIAITVSADGGTWKAVNTAGARLVNGNSDYTLALTFEGSGWRSGKRKATVKATTYDGKETTTEIQSNTNSITLPAMTNVYLLRVNIERNNRRTTTPALIFCDLCATDSSGTAETPTPDIYNLMTEYMSRKRHDDTEVAAALMTQLETLRASAPPAFPGDAYRQAAKRSERVTRITGKLTIGDEEQEITNDDIIENSLQIATDIMADGYFAPGGAPSAEMTIELRFDSIQGSLDEAEIELTYHIQRHDELWCDIPLGTFTVATHEKGDRGYSIVAYDDMKKLEKIPLSNILYVRTGTNTTKELVQLICLESGLEWDHVWPTYPGVPETIAFAVSKAGTSLETAWDLLIAVLRAQGLVGYIDRFRKLRIKALATIAPSASYERSSLIQSSISELQYKQASVSTTATFTDDHTGETATVRYLFDTLYEDGVVAYWPEDPLWNGVVNWDRIPPKRTVSGLHLSYFAEAIGRVVYRPGEITMHGDPAIDLMEWVEIAQPDDTARIPVTYSVWKYRGDHTLSAVGTEAIAGISRTLTEKKALSDEERAASSWQFLSKSSTLVLIREFGHQGMSGYTHDWLSLFRHEEFPPRTP